MKRINHKLWFLIFYFLLLSGLVLILNGELIAAEKLPHLSLSSDKSEVSEEDKFNVSISVKTDEEHSIGAADLVFNFDNEKLILEAIIPGDTAHFTYLPRDDGNFYPDEIIEGANREGEQGGKIEGLGAVVSDSSFSDETTLVTLRFKASSTEEETTTTIEIEFTIGETVDDSNLWNPSGIEDLLDQGSIGPPLAISISSKTVGPSDFLSDRIPNPLKAETIEEFIQDLIDFIFYIALALTPLMIIIAGFYYLTAAGEPKRIKTAKDIILYTSIGFGIILLAKVLISVIIGALGG